MNLKKGLATLWVAALAFIVLSFPSSGTAAESPSPFLLSDYEGEWVDQAFVENEDADGTLQIEADRDAGTATLSYAIWASDETYRFESSAPIAVDGASTVPWVYAYDLMDAHGETHTYTGRGIVSFGSGKVTLTMDRLPPELNKAFAGARTFVRDPYAGQTFRPADALAFVSEVCKCKPSKQVSLSLPEGDNEGNKSWIYYVTIVVRDQYRMEYKVNLHKRQAMLAKDEWRYRVAAPVAKATASSTLPASKTASYGASRLVDKDPSTCWCEGAKGLGVGQSFTISFAKKTELGGFAIVPGYSKSVSAYLDNGSVKKAKLVFSDGTAWTVDFSKKLTFFFDKKIKASSVKFVILEVTPGAKYADTCVSEIQFF